MIRYGVVEEKVDSKNQPEPEVISEKEPQTSDIEANSPKIKETDK